ncbi:MAG: ribonuclease III [Rhodospirillales bacterium]|nr:ribonuclease III [Rhodospirillales bacterium]
MNMPLPQRIDSLQKKLAIRFQDLSLLEKALTHASMGPADNYERLEFLGDRVLGLVMAKILFETFPQEDEGDMAKRHAVLVQGKTLAQIAREIDLGDFMILSESERAAGGGNNDNILADGMEAIIGALFLEQGLDVCMDLIKRLWGDRILVMRRPPRDPKTALQEWAQGRGLPLPLYEELAREGPDHAPEFHIQVSVEGFDSADATGASRRKAEKDAAAKLLARLEKGMSL